MSAPVNGKWPVELRRGEITSTVCLVVSFASSAFATVGIVLMTPVSNRKTKRKVWLPGKVIERHTNTRFFRLRLLTLLRSDFDFVAFRLGQRNTYFIFVLCRQALEDVQHCFPGWKWFNRRRQHLSFG